jgi:hypothetical protein
MQIARLSGGRTARVEKTRGHVDPATARSSLA